MSEYAQLDIYACPMKMLDELVTKLDHPVSNMDNPVRSKLDASNTVGYYSTGRNTLR